MRRLIVLWFVALASLQAQDSTPFSEEQKAAIAKWEAAPVGPEKVALSTDAIRACVDTYHLDRIVEFASEGKYSSTRISTSLPANVVTAQIVQSFGSESKGSWGQEIPMVIRRMTKDRFEIWKPTQGWLFDRRGNVVVEAHPHRRDGVGREWYGAFSADGHWITTDLWDTDKVIYLYSPKGNLIRQYSAKQLVGPRSDDAYGTDLMAWARATTPGKTWIISVGSDGGRGMAELGLDEKVRPLSDTANIWQMCFPGDLEPKGMYISRYIRSPQGQLVSSTPGHGNYCETPTYSWLPTGFGKGAVGETMGGIYVPEGIGPFGFWPDRLQFFIGRMIERSDGGQAGPLVYNFETWFFDKDFQFQGWLSGLYLGVAADHKSLLFRDEQNNLVTLSPDLQVKEVRHFQTSTGQALKPEKVFDDLQLGFFWNEENLVLVRWTGNGHKP